MSNNKMVGGYADPKDMIGKIYQHKNGIEYTVTDILNYHSTEERQKEHPMIVSYVGPNGLTWGRELSDWDRSFINVDSVKTLGTNR